MNRIGKHRNFYLKELPAVLLRGVINFEDNKFRAFSVIAESLALQ
jgi:hypothetical protein